jgi:hypothetical protein
MDADLEYTGGVLWMYRKAQAKAIASVMTNQYQCLRQTPKTFLTITPGERVVCDEAARTGAADISLSILLDEPTAE